MLLQTLVQLNILILATPALAGWSLAPPIHAGTAHAVGIVWQYRGVETPVPKTKQQAQTSQRESLPAALPCPAPLSAASPTAVLPLGFTAAVRSLPNFAHAARAP